jgi:competence protein ComEA
MKINMEPVKSWFGYSRRERRSSFILLIILFIIISVRFFVPERNTVISIAATGFTNINDSQGLTKGEKTATDSLFHFNPNSASYDTLLMLGLDTRSAATLISYRNKGGRFKNPEDIRKVYGIDEVHAKRLIPFVDIGVDKPVSIKSYTQQKQKPLFDINSCDSSSLVRLQGIGPVLSARIIKFRNLLGGFARIDQLKEVYGLPLETYNLISVRLFADTSLLKRINVNSAGYSELTRLPYIEKYEATSIIKYRELKGRINNLTELTENKIITVEKAYKSGPYMRFE